MFPLNSNDQYIDDNGNRSSLGNLFEGYEHDIEELEQIVSGHTTKIGNLETFTGALQDQINPDEYSEESSYTAGDYVNHDNKLYKCNTSCTADTWENNSGYFTETSVANEFGNVADEMSAIDSKLNYSTNEQVVGKWIDGSPIYRKCLSGTTPSTSDAPLSNDVFDIKYIIDYSICVNDVSGNVGNNFFASSSYFYYVWWDHTSKKLIYSGGTTYLERPYVLFIDYVKNS